MTLSQLCAAVPSVSISLANHVTETRLWRTEIDRLNQFTKYGLSLGMLIDNGENTAYMTFEQHFFPNVKFDSANLELLLRARLREIQHKLLPLTQQVWIK